MLFVEPDSFVIDCMRRDRANACDLGGGNAALECIEKQFAPEPDSLEVPINGKSTDEQQGNLFGHSTPQLRGGQCKTLFHGGRNRVVADDRSEEHTAGTQ